MTSLDNRPANGKLNSIMKLYRSLPIPAPTNRKPQAFGQSAFTQ